jgi:hypothetical protein
VERQKPKDIKEKVKERRGRWKERIKETRNKK